jgi:kynurenine formamidase
VTHLDAPSHVFWNGTMYNGVPASSVSADRGAQKGSVDLAAASIVGRGVLLDVASALGLGSMPDAAGITPGDLLLAERHGGVEIGEGDIVFVRTGYGARRPGRTAHLPGLTAACLSLIHERQPAVIATDTGTDAYPSGYDDIAAPVHAVCLVAMGIWIVDNCDLEPLATTAASLARYSFLCAIEPLRLKNSTGCPVNPVVVF